VKRRFRLTPEARADIQEILLDVAADSPDAAERLRSEFYEALQRLGRSPGIGHFHEELLDRRYRFWNFYSYVVCYAWRKQPIQIIAVVHGARDLATFLATRTSSE
jgi:plasmid stabilization system protein ParE